MADTRLNTFESLPLLGDIQISAGVASNGYPSFYHVYIPGSISFNTLAMIGSFNIGATNSLSFSFGLYSLTGGTLSLANSGSFSTGGVTGFSWITFGTSANQDITPGDWWFALQRSRNLAGASFSFVACDPYSNDPNNGGIVAQGIFARGVYTVTSAGMVNSVATSAMSKEGIGALPAGHGIHPYIVISA